MVKGEGEMNKENENKVTLSTERLVLREFNEKDFSAVHAYASDKENIKYMICLLYTSEWLNTIKVIFNIDLEKFIQNNYQGLTSLTFKSGLAVTGQGIISYVIRCVEETGSRLYI